MWYTDEASIFTSGSSIYSHCVIGPMKLDEPPKSRSQMATSRCPPTLETLAPELLDKILKHLLEDANKVEYLGRGDWSDAAALDFFHLSRTSARLRSQFWIAFLAQTPFVLRGWRLYPSA